MSDEMTPTVHHGEREPESVWDYPRPPRVDLCRATVRVVFAGVVLAESDHGLRVLETSHPPTIYLPPGDVRLDLLTPSAAHSTVCEWKGRAHYLDAQVDGRRAPSVAWAYAAPRPGYEALADHVSFYPGRVDEAWVGDERVRAQEGDFYGGWITAEIRGPFKGAPGTMGW